MPKLAEVLKRIPCQYQDCLAGDCEITGIAYDSRKVEPGNLFICISGFASDGHKFVSQAIEKGASAILAEHFLKVPQGIAVAIVENTRTAMPEVADAFYGRPSDKLHLIGVTGTNGKTTTTFLIRAILEHCKHKTGIMGTIQSSIDGIDVDASRTTPEAPDIERFLNLCCSHDAEYMVMEVSSHALDLGRVSSLNYRQAIFTNLTQDHLDYHKTMQAYKMAKCKLFEMVEDKPGNVCIVNIDDPSADDFIQSSHAKVITCSMFKKADLSIENLEMKSSGTDFVFCWQGKKYPIHMNLVGEFNVHNALGAIASVLCEGIDPEFIREAFLGIKGVPGRFQPVLEGQDFSVIVDYAHTPDGLENILKTARKLSKNRIITVFGCGGDRDHTKRPIMGKIATNLSDFAIVTSDNPRTEDPDMIISEIESGIITSNYIKIKDRREAISKAIQMAEKDDIVVIAGKGHENYQLVMDKVLHFDDVEVAREYIRAKTLC